MHGLLLTCARFDGLSYVGLARSSSGHLIWVAFGNDHGCSVSDGALAARTRTMPSSAPMTGNVSMVSAMEKRSDASAMLVSVGADEV